MRLARLPLVGAPAVMLLAAAMCLGSAVIAAPTAAAAPATTRLTGDLAAHDPALVKGGRGEDWYVFSTGDAGVGGGTIQIRRSPNGQNWAFAGTLWEAIPAWVTQAIPAVNNLWAPEVHRHGGTYYLYYVASIFGTNNSVIGLATNTTLDPDDPTYAWVDRGPVLRSTPGDDYNALDPGIIEDAAGTPWMAFGSYWSGIRMVQLQWPTGTTASPTPEMLPLASRVGPPNAIEAPYIVSHDGWYYLFTSWGQCCQGVNSDYRIMVGRSREVTGPYADRDGRSLLEGGGTSVVTTSGNRVGPGGQSVSGDILAYHYYDATANGAARLALRPITWTGDGWPEILSMA